MYILSQSMNNGLLHACPFADLWEICLLLFLALGCAHLSSTIETRHQVVFKDVSVERKCM